MGSSLLLFSMVASPHTCVTIAEAARPHSALPLHRRLDVNVAVAPEELHPKLKRHITDASNVAVPLQCCAGAAHDVVDC